MLLALVLCVAIRIRLGDVAKTADSKTPNEWLEIENPPAPEEEIEEIGVDEPEQIEEEKETDE
jgi:hypothetical protein